MYIFGTLKEETDCLPEKRNPGKLRRPLFFVLGSAGGLLDGNLNKWADQLFVLNYKDDF